MNYQQRSCIELLDDLVDRGIDITRLSKELPRDEWNRVRKRMHRAFGTGENALRAFGLFEINDTPSEYELYRCFYIDDYYEIQTNEYEKEILCDIYYLSEIDFERFSRTIIRELKYDAIDEFYRNEFPDNIKSSFVESERYSHVWNYITSTYGSIGKLMDHYGTPSHIFVDYDFTRRNGDSIKKGHIFESIVGDVLGVLHDNLRSQVSFEGCRPDFVLGGKWYDAKLSAFAPFHPNSTMLERYFKHTDDLTIIYARNKRSTYERGGAKFVHISEYYPELEKVGRRDLIDRCETFLKLLDDGEAIV